MPFVAIAAKWILGRLQGLIRAVLDHPWQAITIALLCASWVLLHRGDHYRDKLLAAQQVIQAGENNLAALKAQKAAVEARQAAITEKINHETVIARSDALAAADTYARAHQCVRPSAKPSTASDASGGMSDVSQAPSGTDEASGTAIVVARSDIDACTLNSVAAQKWYEWWQQASAVQP